MPRRSDAMPCFSATSGLSGLGGGCYTFAAWQGGFRRNLSLIRVTRVRNSMAANRRLALRAIAVQAGVATLVAVAFLAQGDRAALAAGVGGGAAVLGSAFLAWRSLPAQTPSAGMALAGLLVGIVMKWVVVLAALYLALARFGLPPLPLLAGLVSTTAAFLLIGKFKA
jgi:ATP synthase protein I